LYDQALSKHFKIRDKIVPEKNVIDVLYSNSMNNFEQSMQDIYKTIDMPLTDELKQQFEGWLKNNAQHKHGIHQYKLADFGLNESEIKNHFKWYSDDFAIPSEK
jgi:hypothetical protein